MSNNGFFRKARIAALTAAAFLSASAFTNAATVTGGTTSVALDSATVTALTGLGFTIAPVAPATLTAATLTATFPITGGDTTTMIDHSGGLSFTLSGATADVENFVINLSGPQADIITGQLVAGASTVSDVSLFDIGSGLSLTLDPQLASDLTSAFGVPNLAGAAIGTATVNASTASPEPSSIALASLGFIAAGFLLRRRAHQPK